MILLLLLASHDSVCHTVLYVDCVCCCILYEVVTINQLQYNVVGFNFWDNKCHLCDWDILFVTLINYLTQFVIPKRVFFYDFFFQTCIAPEDVDRTWRHPANSPSLKHFGKSCRVFFYFKCHTSRFLLGLNLKFESVVSSLYTVQYCLLLYCI
jgi:hypothetical protein